MSSVVIIEYKYIINTESFRCYACLTYDVLNTLYTHCMSIYNYLAIHHHRYHHYELINYGTVIWYWSIHHTYYLYIVTVLYYTNNQFMS